MTFTFDCTDAMKQLCPAAVHVDGRLDYLTLEGFLVQHPRLADIERARRADRAPVAGGGRP